MEEEIDKVLERWSVQAKDLELGEVIGAGSFGVVKAGTLKDGNTTLKVAVKQLPISDAASASEWRKLLHEAVVLAKASERCKTTCRLYGMCLMPGYFCLVMKRYVTSLDKKLNDYPDRKAPQRKVEQWMLKICQAVVELHAQNVILRDLKPANILLDEFEGAIIADFGIARTVEHTIAQLQTKMQAGTPTYMAPEMFDDELGTLTTKVDVWALGCLLLELQTGKVPWEGLTTVKIITQVHGKKKCPSIPAGLSREFIDMLEMCFAYEAIHRASAMDILEVLRRATYQVVMGNISTQPSSTVSKYSRYLAMDSIVLPLPLPLGIIENQYVMSHFHGMSYVFWKLRSGGAIATIYTSGNNFKFLAFPQVNYEFQLFGEFRIFPRSGPNDMVYIGGTMVPKESSNGATSIFILKKKQFICVLTSPRQDNNWYYGCFKVSQSSGILYCGCSDGTIEVWKLHPDPNQPHVFAAQLNGHVGLVSTLVMDKNDTLYSIDKKDVNILRVWSNFVQVAILDSHNNGPIHTISCTPKGNLYILTARGLKMWCDVKIIAELNIIDQSKLVPITMASSALMEGSEIVHFVAHTQHNTYCLEAWCGIECLAKVDTGSSSHKTWEVNSDGMVYCYDVNQVHRWKLV